MTQGRPKKDRADAKRCPLNMRTTPALRERLEKCAARSGRSLAQEVEYRLEQSVMVDSVVEWIERRMAE